MYCRGCVLHGLGQEAPRDLGEPARFGDCSTRRIPRGSSYGPNQLGKGLPPRPVALAHVPDRPSTQFCAHWCPLCGAGDPQDARPGRADLIARIMRCSRMWFGVGRRHHLPPANLPYSAVCVFPAAEAGRSLRGLTLFGAEWCCCLVPLPSNSGYCCFCCYRFSISVPMAHFLARGVLGVFRGVYPDVFPALFWGSSTL